MALEALQCCGTESYSVDSVVGVQSVVYRIAITVYSVFHEHVAALYTYVFGGRGRGEALCVQ